MPVSENEPVAVVVEPKHGVAVLKFRFVTLKPPFPISLSETVKEKFVVPLAELVSVAVQFPLITLELEPAPHPLSASAIESKKVTPTFFIRNYLLNWKGNLCPKQRCRCGIFGCLAEQSGQFRFRRPTAKGLTSIRILNYTAIDVCGSPKERELLLLLLLLRHSASRRVSANLRDFKFLSRTHSPGEWVLLLG